jgi:hypothetical protein
MKKSRESSFFRGGEERDFIYFLSDSKLLLSPIRDLPLDWGLLLKQIGDQKGASNAYTLQ